MPYTAPISRAPTRRNLAEREALSDWLEYHRATLLTKLDGLEEEQLRRPMVPTGVSLLGLVKHLTEVEHGWFVNQVGRAGEGWLFASEGDPDADFRIEEGETAEGIVDAYLRMCERSRAALARVESLDQAFSHPTRGDINVRWVLLHMIEETARHNGHADVIRELIDGRVEDRSP